MSIVLDVALGVFLVSLFGSLLVNMLVNALSGSPVALLLVGTICVFGWSFINWIIA